MLKRKYRLSLRHRFPTASSIHTSLFIMKTHPNALSYNQYGFVVSKRIDKRAVVRNATKRKLRSCIEDIFGQIKQGYDVLFILKKSLLDMTKEEVCAIVKHALDKQNLVEAIV